MGSTARERPLSPVSGEHLIILSIREAHMLRNCKRETDGIGILISKGGIPNVLQAVVLPINL